MAQQAFDYFKHQIKTSQEVFHILIHKFVPRKHPSEITSSFWAFSHPPSMTVSEYLTQANLKIRAISNLQKFPDSVRHETGRGWLLEMLLKNIDPQIRQNIISRNPKTVAEFEIIALNEEKALLATEIASSLNILNPFAEEFVVAIINST